MATHVHVSIFTQTYRSQDTGKSNDPNFENIPSLSNTTETVCIFQFAIIMYTCHLVRPCERLWINPTSTDLGSSAPLPHPGSCHETHPELLQQHSPEVLL